MNDDRIYYYFGDYLIGRVLTNHSITIDEAMSILGVEFDAETGYYHILDKETCNTYLFTADGVEVRPAYYTDNKFMYDADFGGIVYSPDGKNFDRFDKALQISRKEGNPYCGGPAGDAGCEYASDYFVVDPDCQAIIAGETVKPDDLDEDDWNIIYYMLNWADRHEEEIKS